MGLRVEWKYFWLESGLGLIYLDTQPDINSPILADQNIWPEMVSSLGGRYPLTRNVSLELAGDMGGIVLFLWRFTIKGSLQVRF